jgi:TonB-dependent receptor
MPRLPRRSLLLAATALATGAFSLPALAASLSGKVVDSTGTRALGGAEVRILELNRVEEAATDGSFRFADLPPGDYTLRARYAGARTVETTVTVAEPGSQTRIVLAPQAGPALESVLVTGQQANLASAISRQRASDTVETVLTRDAIGQFPDQNVAESLRRAPGINVLNDQGEGRFVTVRGLGPNLNASSINGARVPAPESDVRSVALDVLPSELVESIEIKKTLTPDMDADTIGASIEINTTSAFDLEKPYFSATAEGSYNNLNEKVSPKGAIDFATTLSDKFGISGGFSYYRREFSTDNVEMDGWDETDDGVAYADTVEFRDYDVRRSRIAGSLSIDFKPTDNTSLYVRGLHSRFEDQEYRKSLILEMDEEPSSGGADTATFLSDDGEIVAIRDVKDRFEAQTITSIVFGGETFAGPWTFTYQGSYSVSQEKETDSLDPTAFERGFEDPGEFGITFDYADLKRPAFMITEGADIFYDPEEYEFDSIDRVVRGHAKDEEWSGKLDIKREFSLSEGALELQAGGKVRLRRKTYDLTAEIYDGFDGDFTLADVLGAQTYGLADLEPQPDGRAVRSFFQANQGLFELDDFDTELESNVEDFAVEENIFAGYAMAQYDNGSLRVIGGVRMEHTRNNISGNFVEVLEEGAELDGEVLEDDMLFITPTSFKRRYTDWLPSLNLRYEAQNDLVFRAAVSRSVVRPNIEDLAPRFTIEENDDGEREGEFGNPDLKPYRAWNFDLSAEWYFGNNAVLQGGFFYKRISDFIVRRQFEDITFNGLFANEAEIPVNGENAEVKGFEASYQQSFTFLPAPFDGLLLSLNYTYTDAKGEIEGRTIPLPASAKHTVNAVIGYDKGPFSLRVAGTYRDSYLDELGDGPDEDRYVRDHFQIDVSVKYRVTENFQIFAEFVNVNDAEFVAYQKGPGRDRLLQYERYSWTSKFGVKATF